MNLRGKLQRERMISIPVDKVLSMDPITFFNKANELMVKILRQLQIRKCLKNSSCEYRSWYGI